MRSFYHRSKILLPVVRGHSPEVIGHVLPFAFSAGRLTPAMPLVLSSRRTRGVRRLGVTRLAARQPLTVCRFAHVALCIVRRSCFRTFKVFRKLNNINRSFEFVLLERRKGLLVAFGEACSGVPVVRTTRPKKVFKVARSLSFVEEPVFQNNCSGFVSMYRVLHSFCFAARWFNSHCLDTVCNFKLHKSTFIFNFFYAAKP